MTEDRPLERLSQHVEAAKQPISKSERDELAKLVRARVRAAKHDVAQREAELVADTEEQLSAIFEPLDDAWAHLTKEAQERVREWDEEIAQLCRDRGVRDSFRPKLSLSWQGRGENADKHRRAELRSLAHARIDAAGRAAIAAIERSAADTLEQLFLSGAPTEEARGFLQAMPTVQTLMPPVSVGELESQRAPHDVRQHDPWWLGHPQ
jgi:hypothetical protein